VKANLGKRLSAGVEVSMRSTFTDLLDGVANPGGEGVQTPVGNNDWYMFTGIFLTYKIFNYLNDCPTYQEKSYRINSNSKRNKSDNWFRMSKDHPLMMKGQGTKKPMGARVTPGAAKGPTPAGHKKVKKKSGKKKE